MRKKSNHRGHRGTRGNDTGEPSMRSAGTRVNGNLAEAVRRRFAAFGGFDLELPRRDAIRAEGFCEGSSRTSS